MANRTRGVPVQIYLTENEKALIAEKMKLLHATDRPKTPAAYASWGFRVRWQGTRFGVFAASGAGFRYFLGCF